MVPQSVVSFIIGRKQSKLALNAAIANDKQVALFTQKDAESENPGLDDIYPIGTLCRIIQHDNQSDNLIKVLVRGNQRIRVGEVVKWADNIEIEPLILTDIDSEADIETPSRKQIKDAVSLLMNYEPESIYSVAIYKQITENLDVTYKTQLGTLADHLLSNIDTSFDNRLACLMEENPSKRLKLVYDILVTEGNQAEIDHKIKDQVATAIKDKHRKLFLEEQLRIILEELEGNPEIALYNPIFQGRGFRVNPELVFVLMPFAEKFRPVYSEIIKPVVEQFGLKCIRADDMYGPKAIIEDIWRLVNEAKIIIADVTDKNPNVFYEIGLAHAVGKDVIILSQTIEDVPFDLRHLRCVVYEDSVAGFKKFERQLQESLSVIPGLRKTEPQA